jgi:hypothetical protein
MVNSGADSSDEVYPLRVDSEGRLIVVMRGADSPKRRYVSLGTTNETTLWDPGAGKKWVLTDIVATAGNNSTITFRDGTAGTTFMLLDILKATTVSINLQTPMVSSTINNNLTVQASAITCYVACSGYQI